MAAGDVKRNGECAVSSRRRNQCRWIERVSILTLQMFAVIVMVMVMLIGAGHAAETVEPPPPATVGGSATIAPEHRAFFENKVRPLLIERCVKCHGAKKQGGGLRLDGQAAFLTGGDSGPPVEPGKPEESLLIEAINYESLEMPPDGKLPQSAIDTLTRWVKIGAPWPKDSTFNSVATSSKGKTITDEDRAWWAFQPVKDVKPPAVNDIDPDHWTRNEIDAFILSKLRKAGLTPAGEADRPALIRRLTFDLIGLPPTPEEIEAFRDDPDQNAYEKVVDRLLANERYGERWGRLWLDLARYADSDGYRIDDYRPNAHLYRDYVIRSFNDDKPYDRFVQEQLAGDEMFPGDPQALIATGFLRQWIYEYNNRDARSQWTIILDDLTDTTSDVFLGLGLQCAKCHDHKFDPILQKDYFRLRAFFAAVLPREDLAAATPEQKAEHQRKQRIWAERTAETRARIEAIESKYRGKAAEDAITKFPEDVQAMIRAPRSQRAPLEHQIAELAYRQVTYEFDRIEKYVKDGEKDQLLALRKELATYDNLKPPPLPTPLVMTDLGPKAADVLIPKKGKTPIEPGFPSIWDDRPAEIPSPPSDAQTTGRRSVLARWLTEPDHPLTTRVIVNRLWQAHFGRGLASNASDFGRLGEPPSHPELLDWLAKTLVKDGWRLKPMHKRIVMSAAYRQSSKHPRPELGQLKDPENRLCWKARVRRLDAEPIRDSLYAVSGEIDLAAGGPGLAEEKPRRSIYLRVMRNSRNPLLDAFDAPFWIASASSRDTTTTPVQSLLLFNSQFLLQRAAALAKRVDSEGYCTAGDRIERAYQLVFGRPPRPAEAAAAERFLKSQAGRVDLREAGSAEAAFLREKIPFRDGQAAVVSARQAPLVVPHAPDLPTADFTIEASFVIRSVFESGAVRQIAAKWDGGDQSPGWAFGITGLKSKRKPMTLVMQLIGVDRSGRAVHERIFSDQTIQLDKPYMASASVSLATAERPGEVSFFLKDLSNDDEPLLIARAAHQAAGGLANEKPLTIGGQSGKTDSRFDGLIDDVRFSSGALGVEQILFTSEGGSRRTMGYWRFEPVPDLFADSSGHGRSIRPNLGRLTGESTTPVDPDHQAWVDLCHILLNSNEFLYTE